MAPDERSLMRIVRQRMTPYSVRRPRRFLWHRESADANGAFEGEVKQVRERTERDLEEFDLIDCTRAIAARP
jgi:hypothetical protein